MVARWRRTIRPGLYASLLETIRSPWSRVFEEKLFPKCKIVITQRRIFGNEY
jgi:hypothetical protein